MFVRTKKRSNGTTSIQIVENIREGDKVKQKTVRHLGQAIYDHEIKAMVELAESIIVDMKNRQDPVLPCFEPKEFHKPKKRAKSGFENKNENENESENRSENQNTNPRSDNNVAIPGLKEEARIHNGVTDVFGHIYDQLNLDLSIQTGYRRKEYNMILKETVLARIANPVSKRKTVEFLAIDKKNQYPLGKDVSHDDKTAKTRKGG